jgi:hypothetical protein
MEAELAGAADSADADPWVAPEDLGPIPEYLKDRARGVVASQRARIERLGEEQRIIGQHLTVLRSLPSRRTAGPSVYLDVTG